MTIQSPSGFRTLNAVPITPDFDTHGRQVGRIEFRNVRSLRSGLLLVLGTILPV